MKKRDLGNKQERVSTLTEKIPKRAFSFEEGDISFAKATEDGKGFEMLAYSGGIVKGHWWFGDVIIDLATMKFPKSKFPILMQHNIERKIGFTKKPKPENELRIKDITYLDNDEVDKFKEESSQGFPFEASISIRQPKIIRLGEGLKETVNGRKVKGPITIFKEAVFKESSVVVFGADANTSSRSFSEGEDVSEYDVDIFSKSINENEDNLEQTKKGEIMEFKDVKDLKEKYPEIVTELSEEVSKDSETKLSELEEENKTLKLEKGSLEKDKGALTERVSGLERSETIRTEKEQKDTAFAIVSSKLSESKIPAHMHPKVQKSLNYQDHMKDDKLDTVAFEEAIDNEVKSWEEDLGKLASSTSPVHGSDFTHKKITGDMSEEEIDKEDDTAADDMVALAQKDSFFDKEDK